MLPCAVDRVGVARGSLMSCAVVESAHAVPLGLLPSCRGYSLQCACCLGAVCKLAAGSLHT
jgi:hypothetical protein